MTNLNLKETVDINVILRNLDDESAFEKVLHLFRETHREKRELSEYSEYIWCCYSNGEEWESFNQEHLESSIELGKLQIVLVDLLAEEAKGWKGIPLLIGRTPIDIRYLLYEMPSDIAIDILNDYIEIINDILRTFEFGKGSKNDTDERKSDMESLVDLQHTLAAIRNDEINSEKEWQKRVMEIEKAEAKDRMEMLEVLHKEDVASVAN